jgi:hypothetical protein
MLKGREAGRFRVPPFAPKATEGRQGSKFKVLRVQGFV